jgi:hypothetical protein
MDCMNAHNKSGNLGAATVNSNRHNFSRPNDTKYSDTKYNDTRCSDKHTPGASQHR